MPAKKDSNEPPKRVERVQAPNFCRVYTSDALIHMSYFDIRITFGECIEYDRLQDIGVVEDRAAVTMTPEHARNLHTILGETLLSYEQAYGTLRPALPPPLSRLRDKKPSKRESKD